MVCECVDVRVIIYDCIFSLPYVLFLINNGEQSGKVSLCNGISVMAAQKYKYYILVEYRLMKNIIFILRFSKLV